MSDRPVSATEIATVLGVEPRTINKWRSRHPDFPKPVDQLKYGVLFYNLAAVIAWAVETERYDDFVGTAQRVPRVGKKRTHCKGVEGPHELVDPNLYYYRLKNGTIWRTCKACKRQSVKRRAA